MYFCMTIIFSNYINTACLVTATLLNIGILHNLPFVVYLFIISFLFSQLHKSLSKIFFETFFCIKTEYNTGRNVQHRIKRQVNLYNY